MKKIKYLILVSAVVVAMLAMSIGASATGNPW